MEFTLGIVGTIAGLIVAVIVFVVAWQLVQKAREGNSKTRAVRQDPHAAPRHRNSEGDQSRRDIPQ